MITEVCIQIWSEFAEMRQFGQSLTRNEITQIWNSDLFIFQLQFGILGTVSAPTVNGVAEIIKCFLMPQRSEEFG